MFRFVFDLNNMIWLIFENIKLLILQLNFQNKLLRNLKYSNKEEKEIKNLLNQYEEEDLLIKVIQKQQAQNFWV